MSNKYKFRDNQKLYFVSFSFVKNLTFSGLMEPSLFFLLPLGGILLMTVSVVYWIDVFIRKAYKIY